MVQYKFEDQTDTSYAVYNPRIEYAAFDKNGSSTAPPWDLACDGNVTQTQAVFGSKLYYGCRESDPNLLILILAAIDYFFPNNSSLLL